MGKRWEKDKFREKAETQQLPPRVKPVGGQVLGVGDPKRDGGKQGSFADGR